VISSVSVPNSGFWLVSSMSRIIVESGGSVRDSCLKLATDVRRELDALERQDREQAPVVHPKRRRRDRPALRRAVVAIEARSCAERRGKLDHH